MSKRPESIEEMMILRTSPTLRRVAVALMLVGVACGSADVVDSSVAGTLNPTTTVLDPLGTEPADGDVPVELIWTTVDLPFANPPLVGEVVDVTAGRDGIRASAMPGVRGS
jgi:hypothetical protein